MYFKYYIFIIGNCNTTLTKLQEDNLLNPFGFLHMLKLQMLQISLLAIAVA